MYVAGDIRITIEGTIGSEMWSNTWSVKGATDPTDPQTAVTALHAMYDALSANRLGSHWEAVNASYRHLTTGVSSEAAWEPTQGQLVDNALPSQLGVRVSLDDLAGHRGGPFLCGFTEAANAATGLLELVWQDDIADKVEDLHTTLVAGGMTLGLDRPTVPSVVTAGRVKVGRRFDVIRRRGNDTPESYDARDL